MLVSLYTVKPDSSYEVADFGSNSSSSENVYSIIGGCIAVFLVLILFLVLALIIRKRRRNHQKKSDALNASARVVDRPSNLNIKSNFFSRSEHGSSNFAGISYSSDMNGKPKGLCNERSVAYEPGVMTKQNFEGVIQGCDSKYGYREKPHCSIYRNGDHQFSGLEGRQLPDLPRVSIDHTGKIRLIEH